MAHSGEERRAPLRAWLRFLLPSAIGFGFFLLPLKLHGNWITPVGLLSQVIRAQLEGGLPGFCVLLCQVSAIATLCFTLVRGGGSGQQVINRLFRPGALWLTLRLIAAPLALIIWLKVGPALMWGEGTGGLVVYQLLGSIVITLTLACIFIPFLTEFGLVEFIGGYAEGSFRRLFTVPGNSAVDAVASWVGSASAGIVVTTSLYEKGIYSAREASVIATNFSIVSISFCYVIVATIGLEAYFLPFYGVLFLSGVLCAMIMPRIPPLSRKPSAYFTGAPTTLAEPALTPARRALKRAQSAPPALELFRRALIMWLDFMLGLIPAAVAIAVPCLILAEATPLFDILGTPFAYLLTWSGVEGAGQAAPAMVIGFADMFLPALLASDIESQATRFIVGLVATAQLIFMSESGALLLRTSIPIGFVDLVLIFFLRTLIVLPIAIGVAKLLF